MADERRSRSYFEAQMALREAVLEAMSWSEMAAVDGQVTREALEAWCRVGRLAVDARHEHSMLTREGASPSSDRSGPRLVRQLRPEQTSGGARERSTG